MRAKATVIWLHKQSCIHQLCAYDACLKLMRHCNNIKRRKNKDSPIFNDA